MRYLSAFEPSVEYELMSIFRRTDLLDRERLRFTAVYLNVKHRVSIPALSEQLSINSMTIQGWFNLYESVGLQALFDDPRIGRASSLEAYNESLILALVAKHSQNLVQVVALLREQHQIETKPDILRRYLKKGWTWRRIKNSLHKERDEVLSRLDQQKVLDLYFSDETIFHFNPQSMYGWQPPGQSFHLPSQRGNLLNILGFVKRGLTNTFYEYEQAMNAEMFELLLEDFIQKHKRDKPLIIVLDRATFHYNERIKKRMKEWRNKQIYLQFLPAYSLELNIIEVVWKHCKH